MVSVRVVCSSVVEILGLPFRPKNHVLSLHMIGTDIRRPDAPAATVAPDASAGAGALFLVLAVLATLGLGALVFVSARAADPLLLSVLSVLGMIGSFFLFGLAAGHIRIGSEPEADASIAAIAADVIAPGVMITARDGRVMFANAAWRTLAGTDSDGEPRSLETAFAGEPQAAECVFRLIRAAELGEERAEEFRVRGVDGRDRSGRWLRLSVAPFKASSARVPRAASLWQLTDISSERAHEAEAVRDLEGEIARYESMPMGLIGAGLDGRITHLNATLAGWLGLDADAVRSRDLSLSDIIAGDGDSLLRAALTKASGEVVRLDLDLVREDGIGLPVEVVARLSASGERGVDFSALVLTRPRTGAADVTIAGAEARFERLFHSAPFGIATLGEDGRIRSFNAAFARMFFDAGLGPADNVRSLVEKTRDSEAQKAIDVAIAEAKSGRATLAPVEISFGTDRQFTRRLYLAPMRDGQPAEAVMLYAIDATEQKALELKYAQSTKMEAVGKLAGGIAHDFNNVLTAILGFSDLLLQTHRPFDPAHKDILNIKKEANRAARLVRQLLAFSRRQTLTPEVIELGEELSELSVMLTRLIGEKIDLKIVTGRDLWHVKADKSQLEQVIINLAVNAKDAMLSGGRLTIRTRNVSERDSLKMRNLSVQPGEYVAIEVEDTGHGMSP
ncbi:MAG: PAS domain-containing protein, partial [Hyphomicrobiaceae bacterium]